MGLDSIPVTLAPTNTLDLTVSFAGTQSLTYQNTSGDNILEDFWLQTAAHNTAQFTINNINLTFTGEDYQGSGITWPSSVSGHSSNIGPLVNFGLNNTGDHLTFTGFNLTFDVASLDPASVNFAQVVLLSNAVPATTPLPAALPLFLTGLSGFGFLTWRRKKRGLANATAA